MKVFEEERWMLVSGWEMKVVHWWKEGLKLVGGWVVNEGGSLVEVRWVGGIITKKEIKVGDWLRVRIGGVRNVNQEMGMVRKRMKMVWYG